MSKEARVAIGLGILLVDVITPFIPLGAIAWAYIIIARPPKVLRALEGLYNG